MVNGIGDVSEQASHTQQSRMRFSGKQFADFDHIYLYIYIYILPCNAM